MHKHETFTGVICRRLHFFIPCAGEELIWGTLSEWGASNANQIAALSAAEAQIDGPTRRPLLPLTLMRYLLRGITAFKGSRRWGCSMRAWRERTRVIIPGCMNGLKGICRADYSGRRVVRHNGRQHLGFVGRIIKKKKEKRAHMSQKNT